MKVLLAEDEELLARAESQFLQMRGFEVDVAIDGVQAIEKARQSAFDVIVLDIMMPKKDGIQALQEIRAHGDTTPVIMLTAKAEVDDRIEGLTAGADDYLTKPFALRELEARLLAQIRRSERFDTPVLTYQDLTLNTEEQELVCQSAVRLAGKETRLMAYFMRNADRWLTAQEIHRHVWHGDGSEEIVVFYVSYLQQKLRSIASQVEIATGDGYRLCVT